MTIKPTMVGPQLQLGGLIMYQVDIEQCSGCETCVDVCPNEAISMVDGHAFIDQDVGQALAEVFRSDATISALEVDFFNNVVNALNVTPAQIAGLTAGDA